METSYVSHILYKITIQQTLWLSYVVLESWAEWNNICDIVTTKDGRECNLHYNQLCLL